MTAEQRREEGGVPNTPERGLDFVGNMLDLFYANKRMYERLRRRPEPARYLRTTKTGKGIWRENKDDK